MHQLPLWVFAAVPLGFTHVGGTTRPVTDGVVPQEATDTARTHAIQVEEGVSLHIVDWGGEGPVLFFVPSWSSTSHTFDDFAPRFTDHYRVLVMNLRGHGPSSRPDHGYTIERLTQDIADVLDALGFEEATLVGLSRSESLTTQFAARFPQRVQSLIYLSGPIDREHNRKVMSDRANRVFGFQRGAADDALIELCGIKESRLWPPGSDDEAANLVGVEWRDTDPSPPYSSVEAPALSFWAPVSSRVLKYRLWCADAPNHAAVTREIDTFAKASIPFFEMQAHDMAIFEEHS